MDGKRCYSNYFRYILTVKKRYDPPDYFRMIIIEEINLFFFDVEDPVHNQKLCAEMMQKLKIKVVECKEKKVKIYIRHSQKNLRRYVHSFLEAYLGPSSISMMKLFCKNS